MAEKKLSEELRHCLETNCCGKCQYGETETKLICAGLLQKAYERIKEYEEIFHCNLGDITYWISDEDEYGNKVPTVREGNPIIGIAIQKDSLYILADGDDEYIKVGTRWAFLTKSDEEQALKEMEGKK